MKTATYHISNLGSFAPPIAGDDGYVSYHDSARYATATIEQLTTWSESSSKLVRNAALTELAERKLAAWQNKPSRSEARETGYEAHEQDEPKSANPYLAGSWDSDEWLAGWAEAAN